MNKNKKKNNIIDFPSKLPSVEKEIEAIIFAAAEPLDIETIESKLSKKTNAQKILEKLQLEYSNRGINLVCISKKWSFRTSPNLSNLMTQEKTIQALGRIGRTSYQQIYSIRFREDTLIRNLFVHEENKKEVINMNKLFCSDED